MILFYCRTNNQMHSKFIRSSRKKIDLDLSKSKMRKMLSPIFYAQYKLTIPITQKYIYGDLIDIGCGFSPYKSLLVKFVEKYEGIDLFPYNDDVTYTGNILKQNPFDKNQFDCAISFEVLEHIPNSDDFLKQIYKIIKPGGYFIISVPHLSRLHEEPLDFYRFTKYGLFEIFTRNGFEILEIKPKGSLFSFFGHQISTLIVSTFWQIPVLKYVVLFLNYLLITLPCFWIDRIFDNNGVFAQGYILVSKKMD